MSSEEAHAKGYPGVLYLDAKEKKYIDECGAANFFGIRDGRYITPKSHSVLPSITNMSLQALAADMGLKVECRQIEEEELSTFSEAAFTIRLPTILIHTTTVSRASGARNCIINCVQSNMVRNLILTTGIL